MKKHKINVRVITEDGRTTTMPMIGCAMVAEDREIKVKLRKVTRRRFIRVAMALGVPARTAQGFAEVVHEAGLPYKKGMLRLIGFTKRNPLNVSALMWANTWEDLLNMEL